MLLMLMLLRLLLLLRRLISSVYKVARTFLFLYAVWYAQ